MGTLEARIKKLESRRFLTAARELRTMSDEQLKAFLQTALAGLSDEDFKHAGQEHPELQPIYAKFRNAS